MRLITEAIRRIRNIQTEMERQSQAEYDKRYKSAEAMQAFQYHRIGCTRTGPLVPVVETDSLGGPWGGGIPYLFVRCTECQGSERDQVSR